jgi:type IX secretion system PorP/SprF family membrane protein
MAGSFTLLKAQQQSVYTHYALNNYLLNPALAGSTNGTDLRFGGRQFFSGLQHAPSSYYLSGHYSLQKNPIPLNATSPLRGKNANVLAERKEVQALEATQTKNYGGIGGNLVFDKFGATNSVSGHVTYAQHIVLKGGMHLSLGVGAGGIQYTLRPEALEFKNNQDPLLDGNKSIGVLTLQTGAWLNSEEFFLGLSATNIGFEKYTFGTVANASTLGQQVPHIYVTSGYNVSGVESFTLVPSVMVRYTNTAKLNWDVNLLAKKQDKYWAGASYRYRNGVAFMVGANVIDNLGVSYAYDYYLKPNILANYSVHELVLTYSIAKVGFRKANVRELWK